MMILKTAAGTRRRSRRQGRRYNLNKEFQALAVGTAEASTAAGSRPPVAPAIPAPIHAPVSVPVPTPVLGPTSVSEQQRPDIIPAQGRRPRASLVASQQERVRTRDRERTRARRANRTLSQQDRDRCRDAERKRARSALLAESEREQGRTEETTRRANQPTDVIQTVREVDRLRHEQSREAETSEQQEARQERERNRQQERRTNQTEQEAEEERAASREYRVNLRDARHDEENEEARQNERTRRSTLRREHALANHEDFRVSMLSGPNIVDGQHKLPSTTVCSHCNAWKWPAESKKACCLEGAVQLPPLAPAPSRLLQLYGDVQFRRLIRAYNQVFAFTSIGASCSNRSFNDVNQDESVAGQHGVHTYRIQGAMGHYLGSLLPRVDPLTNQPRPAKFAQIYIVDPDMQQRAERRRGIFAELDTGTLLDIEQMMTEVNPLAQQFLNFTERLRQDQAEGKDVVDMVYRLHEKRSNPRTHNLPTVSEVGATLIEDGNLECPRDILLWAKDHNLLRLFATNPMYDPLQYPLLLPYGELEWTHTDTYANNIERKKTNARCLSANSWLNGCTKRWTTTRRATRGSVLRFSRRETTVELGEGEALLSEYNRETGTLQHPDQPRRRSGHFLNLDQIGKRVVLPSTHPGGRRHMFKSYQDAMAVVREFGKPDVFVTMTYSPTWDEIEEKIPDENQNAQDRPDIVARVIDKLVSAELPDPETNPQLYETILTCMMHGPCGTANPSCACMKDRKCTKGYPKPLAEVTQGKVNGFPVCRRRLRPPGVLKFRGREYDNATINQWVVPYNPYLSQKYNCHINVEVCTTLTAVNYLYKYVYKGSDKAVITIETVRGESRQARTEPNEILRYSNARYISPVEACMHLLGYAIQGTTHSIVQLTIHLENAQVVTFRSSDNPGRVLTRGRHTMLTRIFELCASEAPENQIAKTMVYQDIPKEFRWDAKDKRWVRRKQFQAALGRMVHVSPRDMERFYSRVLLCHRKGPLSFEHPRTVDGVTYETYRQEALRLGFLEDDGEWISCIREAAEFRMPYQLRQVFTTILVYSQVAEVRQLCKRFYDDLSQDFAHRYRAPLGQEKEDMINFKTLKSLNELLQISGYAVADFDLPQLHDFPALVLDSLMRNNLIRRELEGYDQNTLQAIVDQEDQLNEGQRAIFDEIIQAANDPDQGNKLFFIDGPGGTRKSTLLRHILAKVRLAGKIAIAVASSGIASLLLMGGRTAHSTFKIPLKLTNNSTCAIYKQSHLKGLIQRASLIIWDEAPMTHRHAFKAVDRTLRDIMDNIHEPFGGKIIDVMYADINVPDIAADDYFANRSILTTTNTVVHRINEAVSKRLSGDSHDYLSIDKVIDDNEENFFEQEVLHSININ
ncbi:unnamed protein product [Phytophthora fragariaefolia]|uniref:ATP-dependent DNA helicase n=1 Tax=Phytophthora fragariaefolia TaxID=1490495 RepID=A0A9W6XGF4_9STRA|nr:unnamed protein product [Phytophthora fragariaefolia]